MYPMFLLLKIDVMKRLYRSNSNRIIGGVCGGLAEYLGIDSLVIRGLVLLLFFSGGIGILPYILAVLLIPTEPRVLREEDIRNIPTDDFDSNDW